MKLKGGVVALVAGAGFLLAACGGQAQSGATPTPDAAATTVVVTSAAPAWSNEAVTACRTFVNSVPNMALVQSQVAHYSATMTADQVSQARTGWGLATANMHLPASIGVAAEPEVHQALSGVVTALGTSITDPDYVRVNATAFSDALAVCSEVGVTG